MLILFTAFSVLGFAQGKKDQKSKSQTKKEYKGNQHREREDEDDRRDSRYRDNRDRNNTTYRDGDYHPGKNGKGHAYGHYKNGKAGTATTSANRNGKYSNNQSNAVPMAVLNAFNREFSNAKNVEWRSNGNIYTAYFESGLFSRDRQASYYRDGRRANDDYLSRNSNIRY